MEEGLILLTMHKVVMIFFCVLFSEHGLAQVGKYNGAFGPSTWDVISETRPEINLIPAPKRILLVPLYKIDELNIVRDKKEELAIDCLDTLLQSFNATSKTLFPQLEIVRLQYPFDPDKSSDLSKSLLDSLNKYQADLLIGIDRFRPSVEQESVTRESDNSGTSKRASYIMVAEGYFRIYNKDSLLKDGPFRYRTALEDRTVISGLLAAGPSLVNNRPAAMSISGFAGAELARKLKGQGAQFSFTLFSMKEFKGINKQLADYDFDGAFVAAELLSKEDQPGKIRGRAFFILALLTQKKGDYDKALEYLEKAQALTNAGPGDRYHEFLIKYSSKSAIHWK